MDGLLDRFFEQLVSSLSCRFPRYIVKVSQVKGSFFILVKKPRGKILNGDLKYLCNNALLISESIYKKYVEDSKDFSYGYFPYFKLVKCYGNYHYHFLAVKRDYEYEYEYFLNPAEFSLYFCPHLYKAYKKITIESAQVLKGTRSSFILQAVLEK